MFKKNFKFKWLLHSCLLFALTFTACGDKNVKNQTDTETTTSTSETSEITQDILQTKDETTTISETFSIVQTKVSGPTTMETDNGIVITSKRHRDEEQQVEILAAYKALELFFDGELNINFPNGSKYITSIDDVKYSYSELGRYELGTIYDFPEKSIDFWVTCADNEILDSSRKNEFYRVCKFEGEWITYSQYMNIAEERAKLKSESTSE